MVVLSLVVLAVRAEAGDRSNVQGIGMARTYVAGSRGLDAVGINPANLGLPEGSGVQFSFLPLGVHVGSDFLRYDLYETYFTGTESKNGRVPKYLSDADKQDLLAAFADDLGRISGGVEARLFGLVYQREGFGGLAVTITEEASFYGAVPRDYASFLFYGNTPGSQYDFQDAYARASWLREYAFSFGVHVTDKSPIGPLAVGGALKILHGRGFFEIERFSTALRTSDNGTLTGSVDFLAHSAGMDFSDGESVQQAMLFPSPAGSGLGFDLGVSSRPTDYLTVGISLTDIGSMQWSQNAEQARAETTIVVDDPLDEQRRQAIEDAVRGEKGPTEPFEVSLPTTLRLGVMIAVEKLVDVGILSNGLAVCIDYNQGLHSEGITEPARVSMGLEYSPLRWFPLRAGVSLGGIDHFNTALGCGLHLGSFELDLASDNLGWLFSPSTFSGGSLSAGMRLRL
jgi:hypothetical protein